MNNFLSFTKVFICLIIPILPCIAQQPDSSSVQGSGTLFEVTSSNYLNVIVETSEDVEAYIQSIPEVVTIRLAASTGATSTIVTVSQLAPNTEYSKSVNGVSETTFTSDNDGIISFNQDLSEVSTVTLEPVTITQ